MLMLYDARIGNLILRIVYHRIALIILDIQYFRFKTQAAVFQCAEAFLKIPVDHAGKDTLFCQAVIIRPIRKIIHAGTHLCPLQYFFHHGRKPADRDALIQIVEIIVIIYKTHRQPADDKGRQFRAFPPPLLFRITLYQFFIDIPPHQADGLFFQIFRFRDAGLADLLRDLCFRLRRGFDTPHAAEGIHIKRQIIQFVFVARNGAVRITVHLRKTLHKLPHLLIRGVKNMRPVPVHLYPLHFFRIDIAGNMVSPFDHQHLFPGGFGGMCKYRTVNACPDDQIIILHFLFPPP